MIKNEFHARAVQQRRYAAGKRGVSKAVRRWHAPLAVHTGPIHHHLRIGFPVRW